MDSKGNGSTSEGKEAEEKRSHTKVDCSKVLVKSSNYGDGAFAACDIKEGELIEYGIVRRLTNCDGNENPFVFTWSEDRTIWATGSGASTFYNTAEVANTKMIRYFDEDRFEIFATRDIATGEELTHVYRSKNWRKCFQDIASTGNAAAVEAAAAPKFSPPPLEQQESGGARWC